MSPHFLVMGRMLIAGNRIERLNTKSGWPSIASPWMPGGNRAQWLSNRFERLTLGIDPEEYLDETTQDHDACSNQVANKETRITRSVSNQRSIQQRTHCASNLRNGEEHRDGFRANLDWEYLTDCQVARTRPVGGEEEDDNPGDCLRQRIQRSNVKQEGAYCQQDAG